MNILGCLLSLLLVGFFLVIGVVSALIDGVLRFLGLRNPHPTLHDSEQQSSQAQGKGNEGERPKVFDDDEGEYVDFEEV